MHGVFHCPSPHRHRGSLHRSELREPVVQGEDKDGKHNFRQLEAKRPYRHLGSHDRDRAPTVQFRPRDRLYRYRDPHDSKYGIGFSSCESGAFEDWNSLPRHRSKYGIWGWGALTAGDTAPPGNLYSGRSGDEISVASVGTQSGDRRFTAIVNNGARTCKGDSGGPATRFLAGNYVAFGTHRGSDAVGCATTASTMYWAATSDKASWLETTLKGVYGSGFTCSRYGSGSDA